MASQVDGRAFAPTKLAADHFFSFLLIMLNVQFLMMGLLGEMIMRTYYEAQGKPIYSIREVLR
jgi:hypothetical protein